MRASTLLWLSDVRSLFTIIPAEEKTRSEGTDVAGEHNSWRATEDKSGYRPELAFHHCNGSVEEGAGRSEKNIATCMKQKVTMRAHKETHCKYRKSSVMNQALFVKLEMCTEKIDCHHALDEDYFHEYTGGMLSKWLPLSPRHLT
eukprot:scpid63072/ scgid24399/ 